MWGGRVFAIGQAEVGGNWSHWWQKVLTSERGMFDVGTSYD